MNEREELLARLTGKDAKTACAYGEALAAECRNSDRYFCSLDDFAALLRHKNSLVRNCAIAILAANARWGDESSYDAVMDELLSHVTDEKPITARQCIKALPEIAAAKPNLVPKIRAALESADLTGYRDSMQPLILKDIVSTLRQLAALEQKEQEEKRGTCVMENKTFSRAFFETLERSAEALPQAEREKLYRPCAESCVKSYVMGEMQRQFDECGGDLDRQYEKYGRSEYFFADIVEHGSVYELGYPRSLCPLAADGFACPAGHCECSRQSILYVLETLLPGREIKVELLHTVLTGATECRFRVTLDGK